MLDIYFNKTYGELSKYVEPGECCVFTCETSDGIISNMFIKRAVPWLVDGEQYYDIVTPYGYGGPIIVEGNYTNALIEEYEVQFKTFCNTNKIVCEFIRYHPVFRNWKPFSSIYENTFSRHTVGTNLMDYEDPIQSEFSKSARKALRKEINNGVFCTVHPHPNNLTTFRKLYEETMDRNNAETKYYFPNEYYDILTSELQPYVLEVQAHLNDEIIASEIYFIQGEIMHAHLLGSNEKMLVAGGGIMLEATAAEWGKTHGYRFIHHGGGRTSSENDSLYCYKKKFGRNTKFDFYIGKKIWNIDAYNNLVAMREAEGIIRNDDYFPKYRG